jgi:hypothetical protein
MPIGSELLEIEDRPHLVGGVFADAMAWGAFSERTFTSLMDTSWFWRW